ncbi:MAG: hypothetical protein K2J18_06875 [Paramuribaculum sp.]|nr:hypothetical protein [Paramuribaculum sp.]
MKTITLTDRAALFVERCRDTDRRNELKAEISDLFTLALSECSACSLSRADLTGIETLCDLNTAIDELGKIDDDDNSQNAKRPQIINFE